MDFVAAFFFFIAIFLVATFLEVFFDAFFTTFERVFFGAFFFFAIFLAASTRRRAERQAGMACKKTHWELTRKWCVLAAAHFYAKTFPNSAVGGVHRAPNDFPAGKNGDVLTVEFTVAGVSCVGLKQLIPDSLPAMLILFQKLSHGHNALR